VLLTLSSIRTYHKVNLFWRFSCRVFSVDLDLWIFLSFRTSQYSVPINHGSKLVASIRYAIFISFIIKFFLLDYILKMIDFEISRILLLIIIKSCIGMLSSYICLLSSISIAKWDNLVILVWFDLWNLSCINVQLNWVKVKERLKLSGWNFI
jgi:hypothetical protein